MLKYDPLIHCLHLLTHIIFFKTGEHVNTRISLESLYPPIPCDFEYEQINGAATLLMQTLDGVSSSFGSLKLPVSYEYRFLIRPISFYHHFPC